MKTQMKFQKYLALGTLILAGITFAFSLLFASGVMYESMFYTTEYTNDSDLIGADALFNFVQPINSVMLVMAIVMVLFVAALYITSSNKRRNYYISNKVAIIAFVAFAAIVALAFIVFSVVAIALAAQIDYETWNEYLSMTQTMPDGSVGYLYPQHYSKSVATPIIGILLSLVILADAAAWVYNLIWKLKLMKGEQALLEQGSAQEVAQ